MIDTSDKRTVCIASCLMGLALLLASASPLGAQIFVEGGGGWTRVPQTATHGGINLRAAIGRALSPRVRVRVDAFMIQFSDKIPVYPYSCPFSDCVDVQHATHYDGVINGVAATSLVNIDPRGILYVLGGASHLFANEKHLGLTAGVGLTVPIGVRLRAFAEVRWMAFSTSYMPPSAVPVTVGLRY